MKAWRWFVAVVVVGLVACTTVPDKPEAGAFTRTGRFALTAQQVDDTTLSSVQGGFDWRDDGHRLRVQLHNPFGTVLAQVHVQAAHATLDRSDGSQVHAPNPDALIASVLGRAVPVTALRTWLRGQVGASATDVQRDAQGRVVSFVQSGWQARLSRWDAHGPRLLRLSRDDAGQHVQLRLVIDSA